MRSAVQFLQRQGAGRIIAAVPTGSLRTVQDLLPIVDELLCLNVRAAGPLPWPMPTKTGMIWKRMKC